jgi:hypothetical protein
MTMTAMTKNKLETNQQEEEEVDKWYLKPPLAVKNIHHWGPDNKQTETELQGLPIGRFRAARVETFVPKNQSGCQPSFLQLV